MGGKRKAYMRDVVSTHHDLTIFLQSTVQSLLNGIDNHPHSLRGDYRQYSSSGDIGCSRVKRLSNFRKWSAIVSEPNQRGPTYSMTPLTLLGMRKLDILLVSLAQSNALRNTSLDAHEF